MDGNGSHFLLLLVVLLSWLYTAGDRGPVRLGNLYRREQSTSTTKRHHLSTCSLGQHCMSQRPLQGPSAYPGCLFSLSSLFPFSLFHSMLPFLSFLDFFSAYIEMTSHERSTVITESLFLLCHCCVPEVGLELPAWCWDCRHGHGTWSVLFLIRVYLAKSTVN